MADYHDLKQQPHPYLSGNFAPVKDEYPLTPCTYTGRIPKALAGGQYVRNGGNPVLNDDLERDAHWFDGDGMLHGVYFRRNNDTGEIQPEFVCAFILTDVYLASISSRFLRRPLLPSIATLVNPASSLFYMICQIFRTIFLVLISNLPGSWNAIKRISVTNTNILYHDGRGLATCESGPPIRVAFPNLETVGWFDGVKAEGEPFQPDEGMRFGGTGPLSFIREWTTGHPHVDPLTGEFIAIHASFLPPYVTYSILPSTHTSQPYPSSQKTAIINKKVPGISIPKLMHDFGVSRKHSIILDLPLSLDPRKIARNKPPVSFDPRAKSRFGIFPRNQPESIQWFESKEACCIFHTANAWDETTKMECGIVEKVNLLACRLNSATLVYGAGNITTPPTALPAFQQSQRCQLYYYQFDMFRGSITHQWALSAIPFEFPTLSYPKSMSNAKYIYGCSLQDGNFDAALGRAAKIDCLVKMDVETLLSRGREEGMVHDSVHGRVVDDRTVKQIIAENNENDVIQIFRMPEGWYTQEAFFIPNEEVTDRREDNGWLLTYVFDESQLDTVTGDVRPDARSELWIIDATNMKDVVCRILLPQRVPYGFHGIFITEEKIRSQRPVRSFRNVDLHRRRKVMEEPKNGGS